MFFEELHDKFKNGIIKGLKDIHLIKDFELIIQMICFILSLMFIKDNCSKNKLWHFITIMIVPDLYFVFIKMKIVCNNI